MFVIVIIIIKKATEGGKIKKSSSHNIYAILVVLFLLIVSVSSVLSGTVTIDDVGMTTDSSNFKIDYDNNWINVGNATIDNQSLTSSVFNQWTAAYTYRGDLFYNASVAATIDSPLMAEWNSSYDWGDHSGLYSLLWHLHDFNYSGYDQDLNTTASPTFVDLNVTDDLDVADDIYIGDRMYHKGDEDTHWYFSLDELLFRVGNEMFMRMKQIDAGQDVFEGNPYGGGAYELSDIDFSWLQYDSGSEIFYIDAYNGRVGLFDTTPDQVLDVNGNANFTGDLNVTGSVNVTDGPITLYGDARTLNDLWIDAGAIKSPGLKPATAIAHGILETPAWEFGDEGVAGNQESVSWSMRIPNRMDRTVAPVIAVGWSADGESPGVCEWQLGYLWTSMDEDTSAGAQENITINGTASSTSNGLVVSSFIGIDVPSATDVCIHCKLTRLSAGTNDTIADTVELHGVCLQFTSNKLGGFIG